MHTLGSQLVHLGLLATFSVLTSAQSPSNRTLSVSSSLPSPWRYEGCYTDNPQARALTNTFTRNATYMTEALCIQFCSTGGNDYPYAALSYGEECFCGYTVTPSSTKTNDSACNYPCPGASSEACGGSDHVTLLWNNEQPPQINSGPAGWNYTGCYNDTPSARILGNPVMSSDNMTVAVCTRMCRDRKQSMSGVEWGRECYCGGSIQGNSIMENATQCNFLCKGNSTEFCGGNGLMSLYHFTGGVMKNVIESSVWVAMAMGWTFWLMQ